MPGTCIVNTARKSWFAVTAPGDHGATMTDGVNADALANIFSHISCGLVWTPSYSRDEGINGTPYFSAAGVAIDSEMGSGSVVMEPRIDDMKAILVLLTGGILTGDVLEPDVDGYCQYFKASRGLGKTQQNFGNCKTSQWTLSSSKSQSKLRLDWGIEACLQSTAGDGALPALTFSEEPPFRHNDMKLVIDGRDVDVDDISITGTNNLTTDHFYNDKFRKALPANRQEFSFTCTIPFDDADDVAMMALRASTITAKFTYKVDDDRSMVIDFPNLVATIGTPQTPSGDAPLRHEGIRFDAYSEGTGASLVSPIKFTVDATA